VFTNKVGFSLVEQYREASYQATEFSIRAAEKQILMNAMVQKNLKD